MDTLAERVAARAAGKQAAGGYDILMTIVDKGKATKMYSRLGKEDEQSADLFEQIMSRLSKELTLDSGAQNALIRFRTITEDGGRWRTDLLRNNIFKAANELGIRLPSGMF